MQRKDVEAKAEKVAFSLRQKKKALTDIGKDISKELVPRCAEGQPIPEALKVRVKESIASCKEKFAAFTEEANELECLYDLLIDEFEAKDLDDKRKVHASSCDEYRSKYAFAYETILEIDLRLNPPTPPVATPTNSAAQLTEPKRWKPREEYKPGKLHLSDNPTTLDTWISKLRSYATGIDNQDPNDRYNIVEGLMADEVKSAVKFNAKAEMKILNGEGSLIPKLEAHWRSLYPLNRLRISVFDTKSGEGENWDSWEARMVEEASRAELSKMTGEEIIALLIVMNYKGPFAQKIRSELAKNSRKDGSDEISLAAAREVYNTEDYTSRLQNPSSVKQLSQHQGGKSNGRGKSNGSGSGSGGGKNEEKPPPSKKGKKFDFKNHPHAKQMATQKRCYLCYKEGCPKLANEKCPLVDNLMCSYCQQQGTRAKGHCAEACTKKWDSENRTMGNSIRQLFNGATDDQSQ